MGYSVSVVDKEPSDENLPNVALKGFNQVDVGAKSTPKIPPIPAVKDAMDDGLFVRLKNAPAATKATETARDDVLRAWARFRK